MADHTPSPIPTGADVGNVVDRIPSCEAKRDDLTGRIIAHIFGLFPAEQRAYINRLRAQYHLEPLEAPRPDAGFTYSEESGGRIQRGIAEIGEKAFQECVQGRDRARGS